MSFKAFSGNLFKDVNYDPGYEILTLSDEATIKLTVPRFLLNGNIMKAGACPCCSLRLEQRLW